MNSITFNNIINHWENQPCKIPVQVICPFFLFKCLLFFSLLIPNILNICITFFISFWNLYFHFNGILLHQLHRIGKLKMLKRLVRSYLSKGLTEVKVMVEQGGKKHRKALASQETSRWRFPFWVTEDTVCLQIMNN